MSRKRSRRNPGAEQDLLQRLSEPGKLGFQVNLKGEVCDHVMPALIARGAKIKTSLSASEMRDVLHRSLDYESGSE